MNASPASFGGITAQAEQHLGAGMEQAGGAATQVAVALQSRQNDIVSNDAFNQFQAASLKLTGGDPKNPTQKGYLALQGKEALSAWPAAEASLEQSRQQIAAGLQNDAQRLNFEQASRRLQMYTLDSMRSHFIQQQSAYGVATTTATIANQHMAIAANPLDDVNFNNSLEEGRGAAAKMVDNQGYGGDPAIYSATRDKVVSGLIVSRLEALEATSPQAASNWLQNGTIPNPRNADGSPSGTTPVRVALGPAGADEWTRRLKGVNNELNGRADAAAALSGALPQPSARTVPSGPVAAAGGAAPVAMIDDAIYAQESGRGSNPTTSVAGAAGDYQIMPATFRQYAKPGESIGVRDDNIAVGHRIIADYAQKYNNDPARVAVAYFSGAGNVAPPGSPTPWINDAKDATGKSTSSYVSDVMERLGASGAPAQPPVPGATQGPDGNWYQPDPYGSGQQIRVETAAAVPQQSAAQLASTAAPPPQPDWSAAAAKLGAQYGDDSDRLASGLKYLNQMRSQWSLETATARSDIQHSLANTEGALLAGVPATIDEARIRNAFEPDDAYRIITQLRLAEGAGKIISGIPFASPEQLTDIQQGLMSNTGTYAEMLRKRFPVKPGSVNVTVPAVAGQDTPQIETAEAFGEQKRIASMVMTAIAKRTEFLNADAGGYVLNDPSVVAAAKLLDPKDSNTYEAFARTSLTVQEHLGVPTVSQHVLSASQAQAMTSQLTAPGVDVKGQLDSLKAQWGDAAWPHIYGDMVTLGKLPGAYQSVAALDDPKEAALLARAINETSKGGRDWADILGNAGGKPVAQMLKDAVRNDTAVMQLERSLSNSGASAQQIDGIVGSVETLAFAHRFYNQDGSAAQSAINAFTSKYTFLPNGDARIPVAQAGSVTANAAATLHGLTADNTAIPAGFRMTDTSADMKAHAAAPSAADYLMSIQSNPTWITSPKGDALWLKDNEMRTVLGKNGKPVEVRFDAPPPAGAAGPPIGVPTPGLGFMP